MKSLRPSRALRTLARTGLVVVVGTLSVACGGTAAALCDKIAECADKDGPALEPDSIAVCRVNRAASIDALKANSETKCQELAIASEAFDACRASLDCDDFVEADLGGKCDNEADDYNDALDAVDSIDCSSAD